MAAQDVTIPVEDADPDGGDSAYQEELDAFSDTTSLPSTIARHRYDNGRRYHKFREGEYWGPNDEQQNDQLDISHHMYQILLDNKLYVAPIEEPKKVLDLGCGTGIWAIDFADDHPNAEVIGVDLSPIQPSFAPPNCRFEVDDIASEWTYALNSFDLIHIRTLNGSIADWPKLYKEVFDHLEPGGYLSQLETGIKLKCDDGSLPADHPFALWSDIFIEAGEKFGKSFLAIHKMKQWLTEAGFEDIHETWHKVPLGGWSSDPKAKELGKWNLIVNNQGAEGWGLFLLVHVMKWSVEEANVFIAKYKTALRGRGVHTYLEVPTFYARKPLTAKKG